MQFLVNQFISPVKFARLSSKFLPWLNLICIALFSFGLYGAFFIAPPDYIQGNGFRILYIHAPCAFLSLFIYSIMATSAALVWIFNLKMAFYVLRESAIIGAGFTLLALITGSIWGKPMWGTWWIWDARLTSELVLLFLYLSVILYQKSVSEKRSGQKAVAILTLIGFIDIPIIHYSVTWWNTLHQGPTLKLFGTSTIHPSMLYPLLTMIAACLSYYALILFLRLNTILREELT